MPVVPKTDRFIERLNNLTYTCFMVVISFCMAGIIFVHYDPLGILSGVLKLWVYGPFVIILGAVFGLLFKQLDPHNPES